MSRPIAMVAFNGMQDIDFEKLIKEVGKISSALGKDIGEPVVKGKQAQIACGGSIIVLMDIDRPIPWQELGEAAAQAWWWPEAVQALQNHKRHIIVSIINFDENSHKGVLAAARLVTAFSAALAKEKGVAGVYWPAASRVHEPKAFYEIAKLIDQEIPLLLWVDIRLFSGIPQRTGQPMGGITKGVALFVGREVEFEPALVQPPFLTDRLMGLSQYLIENGPVIQDGETIGVSAHEKIRVKHARSLRNGGVDVLRLQMQD